ncbi:hypothetical protein Tcan_18865 [Toxocara canis]|uniref:Uncharacterized protein n=1 Tax=Toxocara canis TaxID=6265 RepID=A0A0B2W193_TOXCA|nr:hypothetical protein Tcan_18865 [Toxocara canis]
MESLTAIEEHVPGGIPGSDVQRPSFANYYRYEADEAIELRWITGSAKNVTVELLRKTDACLRQHNAHFQQCRSFHSTCEEEAQRLPSLAISEQTRVFMMALNGATSTAPHLRRIRRLD